MKRCGLYGFEPDLQSPQFSFTIGVARVGGRFSIFNTTCTHCNNMHNDVMDT